MRENILKLSASFVAALIVLLASSMAFGAGKLKVVATLPDLGAIAAHVGGEHVEVAVLARPTQDPHYVDAKPSHIVKLNQADLLALNGLELEVGWLPGLVERARNPKINPGAAGYFDASTAAKLLQVPGTKIDRGMGDVHPGGNPHYLLDPRRGADIARALAARMGRVDAAHAALYRARGEELAARLDALAAGQQARFAALPESSRRVVSYHASTIYLTQWLGLEEIIQVEPKPGIAPNPKHLALVLTTMRSKSCSVIIQETYYPQKSSAKLAELAKGKLVILEGGASSLQPGAYEARITRLADALYAALK